METKDNIIIFPCTDFPYNKGYNYGEKIADYLFNQDNDIKRNETKGPRTKEFQDGLIDGILERYNRIDQKGNIHFPNIILVVLTENIL